MLRMRHPALLLLLPFAMAHIGCFTAGYLTQAAAGQYELLHAARPLSQTRDDPQIPSRVRALLAKVPAIKRYGQLNGLTPTGNYTRYASLHRAAAVWVVQGCASLQFEPKRWHFPVVGSVPYLGFFKESSAREFARVLEQETQLDVTVRTASAYSTLGWFKDPVLSTMIPEGPEAFGALANVILHESVHATVYVPNQSAFNESLASYVADELTWLLVVGRGGLESAEAKAWIGAEARRERFATQMHLAYEDLDAVYRSSKSANEKQTLKKARLVALQHTLGLRRKFNNADLAGSRTYDTGRPAFERLRRACGGLPQFLAAIGSLQESEFTSPQQPQFDDVLAKLALRACGTNHLR